MDDTIRLLQKQTIKLSEKVTEYEKIQELFIKDYSEPNKSVRLIIDRYNKDIKNIFIVIKIIRDNIKLFNT